MRVMEVGPFEFHDKIPLKRGLDEAGVRVVPPGVGALRRVPRGGRDRDARLRQHRRAAWGAGHHGRHAGPPSGAARRSGVTVHLAGRRGHRRRPRAPRRAACDHRGRRLHRIARDRRRGRAHRARRRCSARAWCSPRPPRSSTSPAPRCVEHRGRVPPASVVILGHARRSASPPASSACRAR